MRYYLIICLTFILTQGSATENLPWTFCIPESYAMIEKENNGNEAVILAPKDLNLDELEETSEISRPLIFGIKMQFPESFTKVMEQMIVETRKQFPKGFDAKFSKWGNYPIVAIKLCIGKDDCYLAYVSLEDKDKNGLVFTFAYPRKKEFGNGNKPNKNDLKFWNDFLAKTQPLIPNES